MQSKISTSSRKPGKLIAIFATVLIVMFLCGFITMRNTRECPESGVSSARDQNVKSTGHVNDMLFSLKSFIILE